MKNVAVKRKRMEPCEVKGRILVSGFRNLTEFARKKGLRYNSLSDTINGRMMDRRSVRALASIGIEENQLPGYREAG